MAAAIRASVTATVVCRTDARIAAGISPLGFYSAQGRGRVSCQMGLGRPLGQVSKDFARAFAANLLQHFDRSTLLQPLGGRRTNGVMGVEDLFRAQPSPGSRGGFPARNWRIGNSTPLAQDFQLLRARLRVAANLSLPRSARSRRTIAASGGAGALR